MIEAPTYIIEPFQHTCSNPYRSLPREPILPHIGVSDSSGFRLLEHHPQLVASRIRDAHHDLGGGV